ncbi:hypothetical protein [Sandarakinorhabdus sp. AAP62]|uniref:hypothetical protein n=1 Tax=Sandarakinorhabdus sp. AAP62 TaxID=1248916 RepID=UPI0003066C11|nr:hypothetical protein [Sandarakinorhabdus sp. AAP62]
MPWPEFTELSFGYCFLRELETKYTTGGRFPRAPDFISQYAEKTKGYDVEVAMDGAVPLFIQLKRSMVIRSANAREFASPFFKSKPALRMNLHSNDSFAQHIALQKLEQAGNHVIYATSQIENPQELVTHTKSRTMVTKASAIFSPSTIMLPNVHEQHHVSFYANTNWAVLFSEKGQRFERKWADGAVWLAELLETSRGREENERAMKLAEQVLMEAFDRTAGSPPAMIMDAVGSLDGAAARVSVLAQYMLDAQLTFLKPPVEGE